MLLGALFIWMGVAMGHHDEHVDEEHAQAHSRRSWHARVGGQTSERDGVTNSTEPRGRMRGPREENPLQEGHPRHLRKWVLNVESQKQKVITNLAYSFLSADPGAGLCVLGVGIGIGRSLPPLSMPPAASRRPPATSGPPCSSPRRSSKASVCSAWPEVTILLATKAG